MKCDEVESLLSLEDGAARVDSTRLGEHLARCASCRASHPEVAWMMAGVASSTSPGVPRLPAVERDSARRRARILRRAAAAALLLGAATFGLRAGWFSAHEPDPQQPEADHEGGALLAALTPLEPPRGASGGDSSRLSSTSITWHDGRRITSTVERSVWRARPAIHPTPTGARRAAFESSR